MASTKHTRRAGKRVAKTTKRAPSSKTARFQPPSPILDIASDWLSDIGSRTTHAACAIITLSNYPFRSRELAGSGAQLLRNVGEKLTQLGDAAMRCADEIIEEHEPAGGAS
jgi:hypothetical protein